MEKASAAVENYETAAKTRIRWLMQRIVSLAPHSDELQRFFFVYVKFRWRVSPALAITGRSTDTTKTRSSTSGRANNGRVKT